MTTIEWSPQQRDALDRVEQWLADRSAPVFRLFGYAGTGKSTLAMALQGMVNDVRYATFTGKAAVILRNKGCAAAQTIHSMIYRSADKGRTEFDHLNHVLEEKRKANAPQAEIDTLVREISKLRKDLQNPIWMLNEHAFDREWDELAEEYVHVEPPGLIVIDEVSMVDKRLGQDLESFGIPILVLGDPAQLPPVAGQGYFTQDDPDVLLTEIHRQAEGNPIIQMATTIRRGDRLDLGSYGESRVCERTDLVADDWMRADQILVGSNASRRRINARCRQLLGFEGILPREGEKLVCLRNNHQKGLLNGSLWRVEAAEERAEANAFVLTVSSIDDPTTESVTTTAHKKPFMGVEFDDPFERRDADEFDFGYALTVHKAQGSQWPSVVLLDEWSRGDTRRQWQYTGVTRAAERVTVVR